MSMMFHTRTEQRSVHMKLYWIWQNFRITVTVRYVNWVRTDTV